MGAKEWQDELLMGVPSIDAQHRELFSLLEELGDSITTGHGDELVERALEEILGYACVHFRDEEALMVEVGYPGITSQRAAHAEFASDATRITRDWATGAGVAIEDLYEYLYTWVVQHVETMDLLLARFLAAERDSQDPDGLARGTGT